MPRNVPTDAPSDLPTDTPTDLPADLPTDAPSDMPSDLPSDLPRPTCPNHITQALKFNKISEQTGLAKISSLPYHPGPITPRHERIFSRKKANKCTTSQQPASIDALADGTTQETGQEPAPAQEAFPAAPQ
ncbi:putative uncharacterized protein DDB_G0290521 [Manihot esculenta]|uniref:putative uncharacterized protein DDB_G0290521 n=1 Tax=Manihot esculenta TaxID=3983 RepID=UPI001CC4E2DA|nr:putative uncharacterized protein DDB_G0290521 [Manihot esculenta]